MKIEILDNIDIKKPGIYMIKNLINDKIYIGSSKAGINCRYREHKRDLKLNKHHNKYLQRAFNKYGENNFEFIAIINCDKNQTFNLEQYYLDIYKSYNSNIGYNISKIADNKKCGLKKSTIDKNHNKPLYPFAIHKLINPNGEVIVAKNITEFAKNNNLKREGVYNILSGKRKSYLGWRKYDINQENVKLNLEQIKFEYKILSPDNQIFEGNEKTLNNICKKYYLNYGNIRRMIIKKFESSQGWINLNYEKKYYNFLNPFKKKFTIEIKNLKNFCKKYNLSNAMMLLVHNEKINHHKGWIKEGKEYKGKEIYKYINN